MTPSPAPAFAVSPTPVTLRRDLWFTRVTTSLTLAPTKPTTRTNRNRVGVRFVYGYRSLPLLLVDPRRRFSLILADDFRPANEPEPPPVAALLLQLPHLYPSLNVDVLAGDAAFGVDLILSIAYHHLQARRVLDLRAHETDKDPHNWLLRGYDDKGRPLCPFGYHLTANGYDAQRQRRKYFCNRARSQGAEPVVPLDPCPSLPTPVPTSTPTAPTASSSMWASALRRWLHPSGA